MEEVPEIYTLIFNREMYHLFKKTLGYFLYERRLKEVRVAEMTGQLDTYYLESTYRSALNQLKLSKIKERLRIAADKNDMMIDV